MANAPANSCASASSLSVRRALSTGSAPCSATRRAVASPIPLLAPVIRATFPSSTPATPFLLGAPTYQRGGPHTIEGSFYRDLVRGNNSQLGPDPRDVQSIRLREGDLNM